MAGIPISKSPMNSFRIEKREGKFSENKIILERLLLHLVAILFLRENIFRDPEQRSFRDSSLSNQVRKDRTGCP